MGVLDNITGKLDAIDQSVNPLRKVADAMSGANTPAVNDPTGQKAAIAAGQAARQEAVNRGLGIEVRQTPTGAVQKQPFEE